MRRFFCLPRVLRRWKRWWEEGEREGKRSSSLHRRASETSSVVDSSILLSVQQRHKVCQGDRSRSQRILLGRCSVGLLGSSSLAPSQTRVELITPSRLFSKQASGGLFVPILHTLPLPEMEHIVRKSQADRIIVCETLSAQTSSPLLLGLFSLLCYFSIPQGPDLFVCVCIHQSQDHHPNPSQLPSVCLLYSPNHLHRALRPLPQRFHALHKRVNWAPKRSPYDPCCSR